MPIHYLIGDATQPIVEGNHIIVHICNDIGGWGKGFVMAISKKWKEPEVAYRAWYSQKRMQATPTIQFGKMETIEGLNENNIFELGAVQFVQVNSHTWIASMIAQHHVYPDPQGNPPIRYEAVTMGLQQVRYFAKQLDASIHMPRIGCGLAGGNWNQIEVIIENELLNTQLEVNVYDLK